MSYSSINFLSFQITSSFQNKKNESEKKEREAKKKFEVFFSACPGDEI